MNNNFKQLQHLSDSVFNIDNIDSYTLTIELGKSCFRICVVDIKSKRCLFFEDYALRRQEDNALVIDTIKAVIEKHSFLDAQFWKKVYVILSSKTPSLVPKVQFNETNVNSYVDTIGEYGDDDEVTYDVIQEYDANNVYTISKKIKAFFIEKYGDRLIFLHKYTTILKALHKHFVPIIKDGEKHLNVIVDHKLLFIGVYDGLKLLSFNEIQVSSAEELAKTVLRAFKFYGLNTKKDYIRIWGSLKEESNIGRFFKKYVDNVEKIPIKTDVIIVEEVSSLDTSTYFDIYNTIQIDK